MSFSLTVLKLFPSFFLTTLIYFICSVVHAQDCFLALNQIKQGLKDQQVPVFLSSKTQKITRPISQMTQEKVIKRLESLESSLAAADTLNYSSASLKLIAEAINDLMSLSISEFPYSLKQRTSFLQNIAPVSPAVFNALFKNVFEANFKTDPKYDSPYWNDRSYTNLITMLSYFENTNIVADTTSMRSFNQVLQKTFETQDIIANLKSTQFELFLSLALNLKLIHHDYKEPALTLFMAKKELFFDMLLKKYKENTNPDKSNYHKVGDEIFKRTLVLSKIFGDIVTTKTSIENKSPWTDLYLSFLDEFSSIAANTAVVSFSLREASNLAILMFLDLISSYGHNASLLHTVTSSQELIDSSLAVLDRYSNNYARVSFEHPLKVFHSILSEFKQNTDDIFSQADESKFISMGSRYIPSIMKLQEVLRRYALGEKYIELEL